MRKKTTAVHSLQVVLDVHLVPSGVYCLANAALGAQPDWTCDACREELPALADAVLAGDDSGSVWQRLHAHLLLCDECGMIFGELLDTLRAALGGD